MNAMLEDGATPQSPETGPSESLVKEVAAMGAYFDRLVREVALLHLRQGNMELVGDLSGLLDSVTKATEDATHAIISALESISENAVKIRTRSDAPPEVETIQRLAIKGLEACTFQDVTGQRLNRIITSLDYLKGAVQRIVEIVGKDQVTQMTSRLARGGAFEKDDSTRGRDSAEITQAEIDALFQ